MPCAHSYVKSAYDGYEVCTQCATFHSTAALPAEQVYESGYWDRPGFSTIREQVHNVDVHEERGLTKNQFVLDRIHAHYCEVAGALEIGCAPGSLLGKLARRFKSVVGVDFDSAYEHDIREIGGFHGELIFGCFPEATADLDAGSFALVVGLDIFEHSHEPEAFLAECERLLVPYGQLFLMAPFVDRGVVEARMFAPAEHVYLHDQGNVADMLNEAGFIVKGFDRWCAGHETVIGVKKGTYILDA